MLENREKASIFELQIPAAQRQPIVVSVPHAGEIIPSFLKPSLHPKFKDFSQDTDWFVHRLYDFVPDMGITLISSNYSRYVVDLNRGLDDKGLYQDGRKESGLFPTHSFTGEPLYLKSFGIDENEKNQRIDTFYKPYHQKLDELIHDLKKKFDHVLLFEAHSIRSHVPRIHPDPFPKLVLGNNNEKSCHPDLIKSAKEVLDQNIYNLSYAENNPFRGGFITRKYAQPHNGIHALQLEMSQDIYMNESEVIYVNDLAKRVRTLLKAMFENFIESLGVLNS